MGFVFRFEQVETTDQETILSGRILSGRIDCPQRVDVLADGQDESVFSAPLRGIGQAWVDDHQATVLTDIACWDNSFALPKQASGDQRLRLILHGAAPASLPKSGIALGADLRSAPPLAEATAIQASASSSAIQWHAGSLDALHSKTSGNPLRTYPYRIDRRHIIMYAPWFLLIALAILAVFTMVAFWNRNWTHEAFLRWAGLALFGMVDVFLLFLSLKMLRTPRSQLIVTSDGILLPVFTEDLASDGVFIRFQAMRGMLEFWQRGSVRLLEIRAETGTYLINVFLMERAHFEELRRLLWSRLPGAASQLPTTSSTQ